MTHPTPEPIIIAGGGIGGQTAALALASKGFASIVLERSTQFRAIGAGLQLGPNALHSLDQIGIGVAVRAIAIQIDSLRLMDAVTAEEIVRVPLDAPFRERFGNPYAVVHRGDLYKVLLNACERNPLIELRAYSDVLDYQQDAATVRARLANGFVAGCALIGADGLWANVRMQVVGDGPPRVSGHTTYRSAIPAEEMPEALRRNAIAIWAGPKRHIVHYPVSGGKVFNLVVTCHDRVHAAISVSGVTASQAEVMRGFERFCPLAQEVVRQAKCWKREVLFDREPTERWIDGRVALLGDAAHPTLQFFAQGACMAIEDAVCLAHRIEAHADDLAAALEDYRSHRVLRTTRVQLQSRAIAEHIYHPAGLHAQLRNATLRSKTTSELYDTVDWLYSDGFGRDGRTGANDEFQRVEWR